jgi:ribonuclease HII
MEKQLFLGKLEAGCDEAGRGCLAGPVFAAAVILGEEFENSLINDSKQLSEKSRNYLRFYIEEHAQSWAVAQVSPEEIDQINILNASILAMHRAVEKLAFTPEHIVVDGNRFKPYLEVSHTCVIKGDSKLVNIAAASILAKTYRDEYMQNIHEEFPYFNWKKNKGYPTSEHRKGIEEFGPTIYHRKTFKLLPVQMKLEL